MSSEKEVFDGMAFSEEEGLMQPQSQPTEEDLQKEVDDFVANEKNKKNALHLAQGFQSLFKEGRWFTLQEASRKCRDGEIVIFQKLKLLELFGYLEKKNGTNTAQKGKVVFRVVIGNQQKIKVIDEQIESLKGSLVGLIAKRSKILELKH